VAKHSTVRDVRPNRYRGRLTAAAAGGFAGEQITTGMNVGRTDPFCWEILWAFVAPNDLDDNDAPLDTSEMIFQLTVGTQAALLNKDDMQVIASADYGFYAAGAASHQWSNPWPLFLVMPAPITAFAQTLTVGLQTANTATFNSNEFYYEIGYLMRPITQGEIVEYLAQYGQV
jgi:hypothetical protein